MGNFFAGLFSAMTLMLPSLLFAQIQTGVWRSDNGNPDYHHFIQLGSSAAAYINQVTNNNSHPILWLLIGFESVYQFLTIILF